VEGRSMNVLDLARAARILSRAEVTHQVLDRHAPLPRRCEGTSSNVSTARARGTSCVAPAGARCAAGSPSCATMDDLKRSTCVRFMLSILMPAVFNHV